MDKLAQLHDALTKLADGEIGSDVVVGLLPDFLEETGDLIEAQSAKIAQLQGQSSNASATARATRLLRHAESEGLPIDRLYGGDAFDDFDEKVAALAGRPDLDQLEKAAELVTAAPGNTTLGSSRGNAPRTGRPWAGLQDDINGLG